MTGDTKSFCQKHKIRCESEMVNENPNNPDWTDAHHYKVVLRRGKQMMTTYFSMGYAHTDEPKAHDVLDCLASDSMGWENSMYFDDWAEEYGYDPDSRKVEKLYTTIERQADRLQTFLGIGLYNILLWETERM